MNTTMNTSTSGYKRGNPRGEGLVVAAAVTLAFVALVVFLRIWGRYRYSNIPRESRRLRLGDYRLWILLSDITILVSFVMAIVLTIIACVGVYWGFGIHQKLLSHTQSQNVLEMFFLYQIFYKFAAGISKIATCFLLLAISTSQMKGFNLTCQIMVIYIAGYCVACSVATVFQCELDVSSNWIHTNDQSHCFTKTPFWYSHAALNIVASVIIAILPWWLFYNISYKRKYIIATIMTLLSVSEIVVGCVRLYGLYVSSHSLSDLTYGAVTGVIVSQLEVNFGIMAACIPTVMKISEEIISHFFHFAFGRELSEQTISSRNHSKSVQSTQLSTIDRKSPVKIYERFGEGVDDLESTHSDNSRERIVGTDPEKGSTPLNSIKVETTFYVEESPAGDEEPQDALRSPTSTTNVRSLSRPKEEIGYAVSK